MVICLFSRRTVSLTQQAHHSRLSAGTPHAARALGDCGGKTLKSFEAEQVKEMVTALPRNEADI